ncbi:MAG TPA: RIP metalloprotease RseP [Gammaproteobacteria bacterium]|nr:RIP metalloprotease RseP [Gammaproteobacteria bacterium]
MVQLLISILAFIVAISLLVGIHEFGHFWVARRFGIKVLRFSIGFGRPLYRWYDKLGTEYVISAIPFGGYVSLFGEREQTVSPQEQQQAFCFKSVWVRILVLVAGPFANLLFAIFVYWLLFMIGTSTFIPILGNVPKDSIAGLAGFHRGQEIISVEGKPTPSWESVSMQVLAHIGEDETINVGVRDHTEAPVQNKILDLGIVSGGTSESNWLDSLGLVPFDPVPAIVGNVLPGLPAFKAGLQPGDLILSADGDVISSRVDIIHYIQSRPNKKIHLAVQRDSQKLLLVLETVTKTSEEDNKKIGFVGIEFPPLKEMPKSLFRLQRYGVGTALVKAVSQTAEYSVLTLELLKKMIVGKVSPRHISGPVSIAKYAGESAAIGLKEFLTFLGVISISLGVLNLLPIPILDGGHVMYCLYEVMLGRRASEIAQNVGVWIGGLILVGFMILALYNDLMHFLR